MVTEGRRQGARASITFGYHRRPPARTRASWPAPGFKGLRLTAGRRPTWVCGAYVTPMLALVGPILSKVKLSGAHLGPRLGQVGPMWSMLGTSWAHVEPMLGLCWPMLGLCWPMLA